MDMVTWVPGLRDSLGQLAAWLIAHLPALVGSILLFAFGWVLARLLGSWRMGSGASGSSAPRPT